MTMAIALMACYMSVTGVQCKEIGKYQHIQECQSAVTNSKTIQFPGSPSANSNMAFLICSNRS